jgi:hypothetical protein
MLHVGCQDGDYADPEARDYAYAYGAEYFRIKDETCTISYIYYEVSGYK